MSKRTPLWSAERIRQAADDIEGNANRARAISLLFDMRDEYEQRVEALETESRLLRQHIMAMDLEMLAEEEAEDE